MQNPRNQLADKICLFTPDLSRLNSNQKKVLNLLVEAGKLIVPIYSLQENHKYPGAHFYPVNIKVGELEKAAEKNPEIYSPYAVVERVDGKLMTVPYHIKYEKLLKPVSEKLLQAAMTTENKEFAKRLIKQADSLLDGSYDGAQAYWMSMKPYIIDINIGPVERYNDKLLFIKTSYQCWVGIMDVPQTKRFSTYKKIILSARRQVLMSSEKVDYYDKVQARIEDVVLLSGFKAVNKPVGTNLPNSVDMMDKYGSEITLFKQNNKLRHKDNLEVFKRLFSLSFRKQFTDKDLEEGSLYSSALHELAHTYLRYRDSESRLGDMFPVIDELAATVMGIRMCGSLLLKNVVSEKQLETIMLAYLARSFHNVLNEKNSKSKLHYTVGGAIFINYLFESGAIQEVGGISWPNFNKMFLAINELADILERLLSMGYRNDAVFFIKRYGNVENLQRFR